MPSVDLAERRGGSNGAAQARLLPRPKAPARPRPVIEARAPFSRLQRTYIAVWSFGLNKLNPPSSLGKMGRLSYVWSQRFSCAPGKDPVSDFVDAFGSVATAARIFEEVFDRQGYFSGYREHRLDPHSLPGRHRREQLLAERAAETTDADLPAPQGSEPDGPRPAPSF